MSIAAVSHRHVFGLHPHNPSIHYLDESTLLYPSGNNTVLYNTETKLQRFIPIQSGINVAAVDKTKDAAAAASGGGTGYLPGITALTVSANKRYVAVAERGERAVVGVYDLGTLRRRKVLGAEGGESKEIISLRFSTDAKYILTYSSDHMLSYWSWEKAKVLASINLAPPPNTQASTATVPLSPTISFSPSDQSHLTVTTSSGLRILRYSEGTLKLLRQDAKTYLTHCYLNENTLLLSTSTGLTVIDTTAGAGEREAQVLQTTIPHTCLVTWSKGIIAGSVGNVLVYEWEDENLRTGSGNADASKEKKDRKDWSMKKIREISLDGNEGGKEGQGVRAIATSPSEDTCVVLTGSLQLLVISLTGVAPISSSPSVPTILPTPAAASGQQYLLTPFPTAQLTSLSLCLTKPLLAVTSLDRAVRLYNYVDLTCELVKYFPEEAYSCALHPSGLWLVVGFADKLRMFSVVAGDLRMGREWGVRGCREVQFSQGGHLLALTHSTSIQVYTTYTHELLFTLKGHTSKIRSLTFSTNDSHLISAGMDGAIYEWDLKDGRRSGEWVNRGCGYSSVVKSISGVLAGAPGSVLAVGSDKTLREISDNGVAEFTLNTTYTSLAISNSGRMLFAGTVTGTIRSLKYPFMNSLTGGEYQEHQAHLGAVVKLKVSYDDQYLVSAGEDGSVWVFRISDREGPKVVRTSTWADEILITKADLNDLHSTHKDLLTRVEELKLENEYQLRLKDMTYNEKLRELTEKYTQEISALRISLSVLRSEKEKEAIRFDEEVQTERERFRETVAELESKSAGKLMKEYERYSELQQRTADLQASWEKQMREMTENKEEELKQLTEYFEQKVKEKQAEIATLQQQIREMNTEHQTLQKLTEDDADVELLHLRTKYETLLKNERDMGLRLKGENGIMRKKFNTLMSEIEAHKSEIAKLINEEKKLQGVIKGLEKDIGALKKEISERDETLSDKERRIHSLKKKNTELEKFKFVLDYKIKDLKRQIEPRESSIIGMTHQIREMDTELKEYHDRNTKLELVIGDLKEKLKSTENEVKRERQRRDTMSKVLERFRVDLNDVVGVVQEPKLLKSGVKSLYHKYCLNNQTTISRTASADESPQSSVDAQSEHNRHLHHLHHTLSSLRQKLQKDTALHRGDNVKIMLENVQLIREINGLRRDVKASRSIEVGVRRQVEKGLAGKNNAEPGAAIASGEVGTLPPLPSLAVQNEEALVTP
ncbi:Cilia- and flagella-associated protein 57 [Gaertneriomyces sp. JEL0708]|nr:Cilia- and flagella-associated protein 57 [Gaertneriomyces sp. JEL0708]